MTFVERHFREHRGDYAGRRRTMDEWDNAWIGARFAEGFSDQAISTMGRYALEDVQKITRALRRSPTTTVFTFPAHLQPDRAYRVKRSIAFTITGAGRLGHHLDPVNDSMRAICARVARKYRLTLEQLRGQSRMHTIAHPRHEAMFWCYVTGRYSTTVIGKFLGGRDHTTVIYGMRAYAWRCAMKEVFG